MSSSIPLLGQWLGYFEYGRQYGEGLGGERVVFRLFVDKLRNGKFEGKIADLEGVGSNFEVVPVIGFLVGDILSFTKHYSDYGEFDEDGNIITIENAPPLIVNYEGRYDQLKMTFSGEWDISIDVEVSALSKQLAVYTGSWEMRRDD